MHEYDDTSINSSEDNDLTSKMTQLISVSSEEHIRNGVTMSFN